MTADRGSRGRFAPGATAIPSQGGRATKSSKLITEAITAVLNETDRRTKKIKAYAVADALVKAAMAGDVQAAREIANRVQGMPKQELELSGNVPPPPAVIRVVFPDAPGAKPGGGDGK